MNEKRNKTEKNKTRKKIRSNITTKYQSNKLDTDIELPEDIFFLF